VDKVYRFGIVIIIGFFIITCTVGVVAYFIGRADTRTDSGTGTEPGSPGDINRKITEEQRRTLERTERAIATIERIRGITEETNNSLSELGSVNRRASDISAAIRAEADLLADYFRSVSNILSDNADYLGSD